ncbi:MAG: hypothetical protein H5U10_06780 [Desulfacinum sp.]|jgi:ABC-type uncharacterized transport system substrate-binding protein|nr:hypothetical protein [Desulfacinum sp.]
MSYHSPWKWTDDQFNGFKAALKDLDVEYRVVQLDGKRNTSEAHLEKVSREAREIIESWRPDLVYATDDLAQARVAAHYVNRDIPIVFSGVNANPFKYGYVGSSNVTGIMEQEHFVETVNLLREIVPNVKRIAVIFDDDPTWEGVAERMLTLLPKLKDIEVVSWDVIRTFDHYKKRIKELPNEADAVALLGIFTFKDSSGRNVPYTEVLRWTAENSSLPDFSFWKDRISYGTLCAVTVSGFNQGFEAGKLARRILVDGVPPRSLTMHPSLKGEPVISLARARKLGLTIQASLLLSAEIVTQFKWEQ